MRGMPVGVAALSLHVLFAACVTWGLVWCCRDIARFDRRTAQIVAAGTLARLGLGAILFWWSYLDWPIAAGLHSADGFWQLAPDARYYFVQAATAAQDGLSVIEAGSPSPAYVTALALWMRLVGATPTAAVLLNATLAVTACWAIVRAIGPNPPPEGRRAGLIICAGLSLSPALVLCAAQGLKDQMVVSCIALASVGALGWLALREVPGARWGRRLGFLALVTAAVFVIAGIRAYLSLMLIGSLFVISMAQSLPGRAGWPRRAAGSAGGLIVLWLTFMVGAGPYYSTYAATLQGMLPQPLRPLLSALCVSCVTVGPPVDAPLVAAPLEAAETARRGFTNTVGSTNLASPTDDRDTSRVQRLLIGAAAILVPVSLLKGVGLVAFDGGRGLLIITDLDTLVNLILVAAVGVHMLEWRRSRRNVAYAAYALTLLLAVAVPLAYVVTNFGTLFRLRLMVFALVWLLLLAFARSPAVPRHR